MNRSAKKKEKLLMRHLTFPLLLVAASAAMLTGLGSVRAETTILITGSERMAPLLRQVGRRYTELHPDVKIEVQGGGSDTGLKALVEGRAMIASLARPATEEEVRQIRFLTRHHLVSVPIAMDAVAFFVNPKNPLAVLTIEQINHIYAARISRWDQLGITPTSIPRGGHTGEGAGGRAKEELITRHMPPPTSGSPSILEMRVMSGKALIAERVEHKGLHDVVHAVAMDRLGLGFAGAGYCPGVKLLAIRREEDSAAVMPTPETIQSREYPFAHYLCLYFAGWPTGPAKDFLKFAISPEAQRIVSESRTGLVPLPLNDARLSGEPP